MSETKFFKHFANSRSQWMSPAAASNDVHTPEIQAPVASTGRLVAADPSSAEQSNIIYRMVSKLVSQRVLKG